MLRFSSKLKINLEDKEYIKKCLPPAWKTDVKEVHPEKDFEIFIRVNARNVIDIENWIRQYQHITNTSYSVETTSKCSGQRVLFKRSYHCQHKTRHKHTYDPIYRRSIKNTNCPSIFSVAIRTIKKRYQGKDKSKAPDQNKPCEIRMKLKHNHSSTNPMALKFKKVLPDVKAQLTKLFQQGHTAATALQTLKADIRLNFENHEEIIADRSKCPDYSCCHYLFQKTCAGQQIDFNFEFLKKKLEKYNGGMVEEGCKIAESENGFVICLCPPLVRRIHQHQINSSEIVFLDSFSTSDKKSSQIYILITQSESGGLPLGVILTSSNSPDDLTTGLSLLKDMLGNIAFNGNKEGPQILLSDEYIAEQGLFGNIWPKTISLYSIFHVLQNLWKWLQSAKNNIVNTDRPVLLKDFYNMLYSTTVDEFYSKYEIAKQNSAKYKHYLKHLANYYEKRHLWAVCYRPDLAETSSSYSEIVMRVLRDKIFQKLKSFNLVQMVDFIINTFFRYFEHQLLDVAYSRVIGNVFFGKAQLPSDDIVEKIQVLGKNVRLVPSEKVKDLFYMVNTDLLTCTCFNGYSNSICKHVQWVYSLVYNDELSKNVKNIEIRQKCFLIATGTDLIIEENNETNNDSDSNEVNEQNVTPNNLFEEMYVSMESSNIVDIDEYLIKKKKDDSYAECKEHLQRINNKFEALLHDNPEEMLEAMNVIYSRFTAVENISNICTIFSIEDPGTKIKVPNKKNINETIASSSKQAKKRKIIITKNEIVRPAVSVENINEMNSI